MISFREARDVIISVLALSVALMIANHNLANGAGLRNVAFWISFYAITVGTGFVLHEFAHKFVAIHYGAKAQFQMWPLGLVVALVTSFFGFLFVAPGAVYIYAERITKQQNGIISIAGPLTNLFLAFIFIGLSGIYPLHLGATSVWGFAAMINLGLGMFNMLPIFPLDGSKVMDWNFIVWALVSGVFVFLFFF